MYAKRPGINKKQEVDPGCPSVPCPETPVGRKFAVCFLPDQTACVLSDAQPRIERLAAEPCSPGRPEGKSKKRSRGDL